MLHIKSVNMNSAKASAPALRVAAAALVFLCSCGSEKEAVQLVPAAETEEETAETQAKRPAVDEGEPQEEAIAEVTESAAEEMQEENAAVTESEPTDKKEEEAMKDPVLLYQGHASLRIVTGDDKVIYIDPFSGEGYDMPADLILQTHDHFDHKDMSKSCHKVCPPVRKYLYIRGSHNSHSYIAFQKPVPQMRLHKDNYMLLSWFYR